MISKKQDIHPGFLKTRKETEDWLDMMEIDEYLIQDDLTINVSCGVLLSGKNLDYIPVQFRVVSGYFDCSYNSLISLKGCPTKVGNDFSCFNNNLTSLEHCTTKVGGSFDCSHNKLISLEHCLTKVDGNFYCENNNLTSLEHGPTKVDGSFNCSENIIVSEIPKGYFGEDNPSWETDDPELISIRFFDTFEGLDGDTKVDVLATLKKLEPEFYNSEAFQVYNPDSMIKRIQRSREVTGGLFEL